MRQVFKSRKLNNHAPANYRFLRQPGPRDYKLIFFCNTFAQQATPLAVVKPILLHKRSFVQLANVSFFQLHEQPPIKVRHSIPYLRRAGIDLEKQPYGTKFFSFMWNKHLLIRVNNREKPVIMGRIN